MSCTGACVCGVWVVCGVPVWVIVGGRSGTVEVVVRILSVGRTGEEKSGGNGVGEGGEISEGDDVCDGVGVDGTTIAVMTGAPVVDECNPGLAVLPTSILVDTAAVVVMNHTVTSRLLVCSSTPLFRSPRT